jgi:hypothetical protein
MFKAPGFGRIAEEFQGIGDSARIKSLSRGAEGLAHCLKYQMTRGTRIVYGLETLAVELAIGMNNGLSAWVLARHTENVTPVEVQTRQYSFSSKPA